MSAVIDIHQQILCVQQEIEMRKRVYPKRVKEGYMTQADATFKINAMKEVLLTLRQVAQPDLPQL